ncbi:MAG: flagellar basal-body MS-ring/collar protein FliF [Jatrophihabitans sp.]|uniref:flagellar basal-body MS-ring/collar protein FliF n=1 Tax=Jatrophihabitans sp. TaxID=1932789 RepID=UPI003F81DD95
MKTQITDTSKKLWNDFRGFPIGQQIVVGVALVALVVGGLIYTMWTPSATYAPLYTNLAPTDASAIIDKLNASGTPYQLAAAGTEIDVPQDKVYSARLTVSAAGLPSSGQTGYALLDKEGVTTSDFKQQVDYQRAVEGELARTIQSIQGVTAASVHLAIPQQTVFNDSSSKPTASVLLTVAPGTTLTTQQVQSVVYLVSSAVPNMVPGGVTVADSNGNVLSAPGSGVTDAAATSTQVQATQAKNNELQTSLQAMLDRLVGPNHATVTVNSTLNFDQTQTQTTTPTYNKNAPPLSVQTKTETYQGGKNPGGTLGTGGTTAGGTTVTGGGSYKNTETTQDNSVGKQTTSTVVAPGGVKQLSIAVMLDSNVKGVNTAAITNLIKSGAGFNAARGDQLSVQALPFDQTSAKADAQATAASLAAQKAQQAHDDLMSMIRQGSIVGVVLLVLLVAWLSNRKRLKALKAAAADDDDEDEDEDIDDDDFLMPRGGTTVHRPAPVEDAAMLAEMQEAAARRKAFISLAEEQPDDVARVLSGWLS